MKNVLVDSSSWINYFKNENTQVVNFINKLLDTYIICTNDIILTELIPVLDKQKEYELIDLMNSLIQVPLNIDWPEIIKFQTENIKNGINKIGIPDLIIVQNVLQNNLSLFSLDKHFNFMKKTINFDLIQGNNLYSFFVRKKL